MELLPLILYLGFLLFYGIYQGRKIKSAGDFSTGTKRHGLFVIFASLSAGFIGGGFSFGNAAEVYKNGIGNIVALWGFSVGQMLIGAWIMRRARIPKTATSPGGIIEPAYGRAARVVAGLSCVAQTAGILGAQIAAIGTIFNALIGVPYHMGVIIGFTVVIIYSAIGGVNAIITAEVLEFLLLSVGLPVLAIAAISYAGGWDAVVGAVPPSHFDVFGGKPPIALISLFLTMMVGEALSPTFLQRLLSGRDDAVQSRATFLSGLVSIPVFVLTGIVGLAALAVLPGINPDAAMPEMVLRALPGGIRGIVMTATLAIVISSADGLLSSASIAVVNDIVTPLRFGRSDKSLLYMRISTVFIGVAGMAMALWSSDVFALLIFAYAAWAPVMLVPMAATLLGHRGSRRQFLIPAILGGITALLWNFAPAPLSGIQPTLAGVLANLAVFTALKR